MSFYFQKGSNNSYCGSRFINTQGKPGHNVPCDLHLEHVNCLVKTAVSHRGANVAITRVGRCAGPLMKVCKQYDHNTFVAPASSRHTAASFGSDLKKVVGELVTCSQVFKYKAGRKHLLF